VGIKDMQLMLLKISLLLGVEVHTLTQFMKVGSPVTKENGVTYWCPVLKKGKEGLPAEAEDAHFNVLLGADGASSKISGTSYGFEHKVLKGSEAIGITANFVNTRTKEETQLNEFGLLSCYDQSFFNRLQKEHGLHLENLVYYRGETHYFVMTAKRASLVETGVCLHNFSDINLFLSPSNLVMVKLEDTIRKVASFINLPATVEWAENAKGGKDRAIFDFSQKKAKHGTFPLR